MLKDPLIQASFGLGVSYFMFLYMSLNLACAEVTGIECGKHYGLKIRNDQDFKEGKTTKVEHEAANEVIIINYNGALGKGFILVSMVLLFSIITFVFAVEILYAISISPENAYLTGYMVKFLIPGMILQSINFQLQSFVQAQDIMKPIGIANIVSIVACTCMCNWLVFDLKVGILLFPICKIVMEVCNMIGLCVCFCFAAKGTVRCASVADITKGLSPFLCQGFKFIAGLYAEFLGFEFNTYLAGLTHNQDQIAAFVAWVNIGGFLFTVGLGFSNVTRTRVANYMGSKDAVKSENSAKFYIFLSAMVGLMFFVLIECFRYQIASIYSPLPVIKDIIATLLIGYAFGAVCELILGCQNTLMRLTNRAMTMTWIMLSLYIVTLGCLSYFLGFFCGYGVPGMVMAFVVVSFLVNISFFFLINWRTDWEKCIEVMKENEKKEE